MNETITWTAPRSAMSLNFSGLLDKLVAQHGLADLDAEGVDAFCAQPGDSVLLLVDDPDRVAESWDLAVIFPDLVKACGAVLRAGVLRPAQMPAVQKRYGINRLPALLFLRDGGYVGTIEGLRDWAEFVPAFGDMLQRTVSRAPGIGIPVATATSSSCH